MRGYVWVTVAMYMLAVFLRLAHAMLSGKMNAPDSLGMFIAGLMAAWGLFVLMQG